MIGVVMAGGKGSRMMLKEHVKEEKEEDYNDYSNNEKLLLRYKNKPVIFHVVDALIDSKCFSKIIALTSKNNSPQTRQSLVEYYHDGYGGADLEIFDTLGKSYTEDLSSFLSTVGDEAVFITSGDLPLLDKEIIQKATKRYDSKNIWKSFVVTRNFLGSLGIKSSSYQLRFNNNDCYYTGISLVNAKAIQDMTSVTEVYEILDDKRIAFNLNTAEDYNNLLCST